MIPPSFPIEKKRVSLFLTDGVVWYPLVSRSSSSSSHLFFFLTPQEEVVGEGLGWASFLFHVLYPPISLSIPSGIYACVRVWSTVSSAVVAVGERGWWRSAQKGGKGEREKKAFKWIIAAAVVSDQPVPDRDGLSPFTRLLPPIFLNFFLNFIFFI